MHGCPCTLARVSGCRGSRSGQGRGRADFFASGDHGGIDGPPATRRERGFYWVSELGSRDDDEGEPSFSRSPRINYSPCERCLERKALWFVLHRWVAG